MKTTSVILLGVVGVGAVGAYMYFKNKQAQDALLGALPATNQLGGLPSTPTTTTTPTGGATTPTGGATTTTPTGGSTTPNLSTQSDGVSPSDANINLANATIMVAERAVLQAKIKAPMPKMFEFGKLNPEHTKALTSRTLAQKQLVELDAKLAKLGYKVDATGSLVRI